MITIRIIFKYRKHSICIVAIRTENHLVLHAMIARKCVFKDFSIARNTNRNPLVWQYSS